MGKNNFEQELELYLSKEDMSPAEREIAGKDFKAGWDACEASNTKIEQALEKLIMLEIQKERANYIRNSNHFLMEDAVGLGKMMDDIVSDLDKTGE